MNDRMQNFFACDDPPWLEYDTVPCVGTATDPDGRRCVYTLVTELEPGQFVYLIALVDQRQIDAHMAGQVTFERLFRTRPLMLFIEGAADAYRHTSLSDVPEQWLPTDRR